MAEEIVPNPGGTEIPKKHDAQSGILQASFERLIHQAQSGQQEVSESTTSHGGSSAGAKEELFATLDYNKRPKVGVRLQVGQATAEYQTRMYSGRTDQHGEILCVETGLDMHGNGRHESGLPYGASVDDLSERVDSPMIQAMANSVQAPLLHTVTVDVQFEDRIERIKRKGYIPRPGYPQFYDYIYMPDPSQAKVGSTTPDTSMISQGIQEQNQLSSIRRLLKRLTGK